MEKELIWLLEKELEDEADYDVYPDNSVKLHCDTMAEELVKKGWTKQIWHKVAEGDLPERQGQKVWIYTKSGDYYEANYYDDIVVGGRAFFERRVLGRISGKDVIAWTELPAYKE